jgi:hypothetical protein
MVSGEEDFTKRIKGVMDLWYIKSVTLKDPSVAGCLPVSIEHVVDINHLKIKSVTLKDPTVAACVPTSIENAAIAYNVTTNRFRVDIEAMTVGTIDTNITDKWARQLGQVDLARVLGAALAHANPVIVRLTTGTTWLDPTQIRALTSTDAITVYGSLDKLQQRATTKELIVQIQHQGVEKDPTQIRALTSSDVVTVKNSVVGDLLATVTQAAKDRTISSQDATGTAQQIDLTFTGSENKTARTPAGGKKIRLKFLSLELSADVTLGYRFGAAGAIYYLRTTKGPYASNLIGANNEGAADEALIFNASAAATIKGYAMVQEL